MHPGGQNAYDRVALVVERNAAVNHARISAKTALPQSVAQNYHRCVSRPVFFGNKRASRHRVNPQHREKSGIGVGRLDSLRLAFT